MSEGDDYCSACNGSGEGSYDGSSCSTCGGSGHDKQEVDERDWGDVYDEGWGD